MEEREMIEITGAAENNLKNIQLRIPKERLVVLTGVSGSGKAHWPLIRSRRKAAASGRRRCRFTCGAACRTTSGPTWKKSRA